ncbi:hypothetical protein MKW94_013829 [Papaver nudicaule]|uniref:IAA-alanine resistance protein 1 n=1 Tax=Papaver nudicaule TaxID=74823 RepID=A0AA41UZP3_PAPNU|nr:hypothetical protein [Papaver nudicaule]
MAYTFWLKRLAILFMISILSFNPSFGHQGCSHGSSPPSQSSTHKHHHHHHHEHSETESLVGSKSKLPEELAEEEDLKLYGFGSHHHDHDHDHKIADDSMLSGLGLWIHAMGCSLLVSMASLICLIILPVILFQGKPSKIVVDSLAAFGAGAMLGDAFLHQLPHAFGGQHSHSHHGDHGHNHSDGPGNVHSHSHSLKDLSIGISVLSGIVLFLLVEKVVRYVEEHSRGANAWGHGHHHHHRKSSDGLKDDDDAITPSVKALGTSAKEKTLDGESDGNKAKPTKIGSAIHKRVKMNGASKDDKPRADSSSVNTELTKISNETDSSPSNLVFGYLNLFSDGVHNFTDGMALGSAFLLYGSVGGWSRTLFLLAHELPQEIGDFGILVRSGFSVSKALAFNFLSALVALAGTALALLLGQDPGQSSLVEGFTAGGFIYIAVAGVLPEMNSGKFSFRSTGIQLTSLILGMAVALCISLVE